jgi:hypothetical protein
MYHWRCSLSQPAYRHGVVSLRVCHCSRLSHLQQQLAHYHEPALRRSWSLRLPPSKSSQRILNARLETCRRRTGPTTSTHVVTCSIRSAPSSSRSSKSTPRLSAQRLVLLLRRRNHERDARSARAAALGEDSRSHQWHPLVPRRCLRSQRWTRRASPLDCEFTTSSKRFVRMPFARRPLRRFRSR